jgi:hypothetical protein
VFPHREMFVSFRFGLMFHDRSGSIAAGKMPLEPTLRAVCTFLNWRNIAITLIDLHRKILKTCN